MERILEPELMNDEEQARAYAEADFEASHTAIVNQFDRCFPGDTVDGPILDLGCGPGDIAFRFARKFPNSRVTGVDGAGAMLSFANQRKEREPDPGERIRFIEGFIPGVSIPKENYAAIVSNSLLHHLHDPGVLWQTVQQYAGSGTRIFIADLKRPESEAKARAIVEEHSANEPEVLKEDFYNSLCAAFEPDEIEQQLTNADLSGLTVEVIDDHHLVIFGII